MYISWIIPTYNEEKRIEKSVREVDAYLKNKNFSGGYEIIISDSASSDSTPAIIKRLQSEMPSLYFLNTGTRGKGLGVKVGVLKAKGEIRLFSDADNSTSPDNFDAMIPLFQKGYDVVISSRNSRDVAGASRDVKEPMIREIFGMLGNIFIQIVGGVWGIWDTQNGFKAMTARATETIFSRIRMKGFSFDIEMLVIARRHKMKIGIIPIRWRFDPQSTVTFKAYLEVLYDVWRIRLNSLFGVYK